MSAALRFGGTHANHLRDYPVKGEAGAEKTLAANATVFGQHPTQVIIVSCGGDANELARLLENQDIHGYGICRFQRLPSTALWHRIRAPFAVLATCSSFSMPT